MSTFSIDQPFLNRILSDIGDGRIQLPDFQRDWVWDDSRIRSLIASVCQEFPIGSVLTLRANGTGVRFKPRLIEGINSKKVDREPDTLILDGQQRLTALFQTLMSESPVSTKNAQGREIRRYYYLDVEVCINSETAIEDAVISCGEDHLLAVRTSDGQTEPIDLSSTREQYANSMFPVHKIFDSTDWRQGYSRYWRDNDEKIEWIYQFESKIIQCFNRYNVPVIELREIPREAVCLIFEKVNTGGVTLTVFDLLTASFAIDDFQLREDWDERFKHLKKQPVLGNLDSTDFLRALTLLSTNANPKVSNASCTRRSILQLTVEDYKKWAEITEKGFIRAAEFLRNEKIFRAKDIPYQTQLIALAAILASVNTSYESAFNDEKSTKEELRKSYTAKQAEDQKIPRWFWCGVFGEMYAGAANTQIANDFSEVTSWLRGEVDLPATIQDSNFQPNRLREVQSRASAVYKGVYALLNKCRDFRTGVPIDEKIFFDDKIDIHHIFPKKWCDEQGIESKDYNCIINKTALSARTNRMIGGRAPSEYLPRIQKEVRIDDTEMDEILDSHLIPAYLLRADDFSCFLEVRKNAMLDVIEAAMGKKVTSDGDLDDFEDLDDLEDVDIEVAMGKKVTSEKDDSPDPSAQ